MSSNIPQPPNVPSTLKEDDKFEIYTRLTVKVEESLQVHKLNKSDVQHKYDLLACEIGNNEKALNSFCGGHLNCDILALELSNPKLCFILRTANLNLPREKGVLFEISYRDLLASQSIRINTIANARLLIEKCKGKNVLFSSGAKYKLDFRSPVDVANLGELFGLKENLSKEAVFWNGLRAIKHSGEFCAVLGAIPISILFWCGAIQATTNSDRFAHSAGIRKVPMSSVIGEEKGDSGWLRDALKVGRKDALDSELEAKKGDEEDRKRKELSDDQTSVNKKAKIET